MLEKNVIIKELKNEELFVRNAVYFYACRFHLYDDKDINEAIIQFINNNYKEVYAYFPLFKSKLNKEIIECLIKIHIEEKNSKIKTIIEDVLVEHYNLIKDLDYNFEEIFENEYYKILYNKIKHFSKKEPKKLIDLYIHKTIHSYGTEVAEYESEVVPKAIEIAMLQNEDTVNFLKTYLYNQRIEDLENNTNKLLCEDIKYLLYPLCKIADKKYSHLLLEYYLIKSKEDIEDQCKYYFSNVCDDKFVKTYIESLKALKNNGIRSYCFYIAEFLNSEDLDNYLFDFLRKTKKQTLKKTIISILASKFDKRIIPYAIKYLGHNKFEDRQMQINLASLFVLENIDSDDAKKVIENTKNEYIELSKEINFENLEDFV